MKPSILLRIASVIGVLFAIGHSIGAPWTPATGPQETALFDSMTSIRFSAMGADRCYWDFYFGFGLQVSVYLFALALVLWQTASLGKPDARRARPMMLILLAAYAGIGVVGWMYFFSLPVILSAAISLCIVLAWVSAGRQQPQRGGSIQDAKGDDR